MGKVSQFLWENAPTIEMCASGSFVILGGAALCLWAPEIAATTKKLQKMAADGAPKTEIAKEAIKGYVKYAGIGFACQIAGIILACHSKATLESRLEGVAASLAAVTASFASYRGRVVEDVGADKDLYYYTGQKVETVKTENGQETKIVVPDENIVKDNPVLHSFIFNETNPNFEDNYEVDYNTLVIKLAAINRKLERDGYIFDNEIFKAFQAPLTKSGQFSGALRDWPDGTCNHKLRLNPKLMQGFLNGTQNWCICEIQYEDGTPLHNNILDCLK